MHYTLFHRNSRNIFVRELIQLVYRYRFDDHKTRFKTTSPKTTYVPRITVILCSSLGHHHLHELLIVDLSIAIDISLTNHLIDLLIG